MSHHLSRSRALTNANFNRFASPRFYVCIVVASYPFFCRSPTSLACPTELYTIVRVIYLFNAFFFFSRLLRLVTIATTAFVSNIIRIDNSHKSKLSSFTNCFNVVAESMNWLFVTHWLHRMQRPRHEWYQSRTHKLQQLIFFPRFIQSQNASKSFRC